MTPRGWQLARIAAYVLLGLVALQAVRTLGTGNSADQWAAGGQIEHQTVQKLLTRHDAYVRQATGARHRLSDSLQAILGALRASQAQGASLLAAAQTGAQLRAAAEVFARTAQTCTDGLTLCTQRGDSLARQDSLHMDSLRTALSRMDSTLAVGLTVTRCRFLLVLPCVSRMTALEVGLLGGLAVGWALHR